MKIAADIKLVYVSNPEYSLKQLTLQLQRSSAMKVVYNEFFLDSWHPYQIYGIFVPHENLLVDHGKTFME